MILNFGAGPSMLPNCVLEQLQTALYDWEGSGYSILSQPFRNAKVEDIINEASHLMLELCGLSALNYDVVFMQGGARMQFAMLPLNYHDDTLSSLYYNAGYWPNVALAEALRVSNKVATTTLLENVVALSYQKKYLHITTNNTIEGTQLSEDIAALCPLVADMSSDILAVNRDFAKYSLFYACAQKQLGAAGNTVVVIAKKFEPTPLNNTPEMLLYTSFIKSNSLYTTPNLLSVFTTLLLLRWAKAQGGIAVLSKNTQHKAAMLYEFLDEQPHFRMIAHPSERSVCNITFKAIDDNVHQKVLALCTKYSIKGIEGHRSSGGFRVSNYNAITTEMIRTLIDVMSKIK